MLLFDQNISYRIIKKVSDDFPNSIHVSRTGLIQPASDKSIWAYAKSNQLTIVTFDEDFSDLVTLEGFPPKVIWFRSGTLITAEIATKLLKHKLAIHQFIAQTENGILEIY